VIVGILRVEIVVGEAWIQAQVDVTIALDELIVPIIGLDEDGQAMLAVDIDDGSLAVIPFGRIVREMQNIAQGRALECRAIATVDDGQFSVLKSAAHILAEKLDDTPDPDVGDGMASAFA